MSARRMPGAADPMDPSLFDDGQPLHETVIVLDELKTSVNEAKGLVHETQSKVEELAKSLDKAKSPSSGPQKK